MNDFDYDVMLKKRIASGAKHRKCGSKSKKCSLSTDNMSRKQWKERCGNVMTYQLGKPMDWESFRGLPPAIQKEYLLDLIKRYSVTASDLAKMFGITAQTVTKYCKQDEIGIGFQCGKRMNRECRDRFEEFLSGDIHSEKQKNLVEQEETKLIDINDTKESRNMKMTEFSLTFNGEFNYDMIYNSIMSMLPRGTNVRLEVKCTIQQ